MTYMTSRYLSQLSTFRIEQVTGELGPLVDDIGLGAVVELLAIVCREKSQQARPVSYAVQWSRAAELLSKIATSQRIRVVT